MLPRMRAIIAALMRAGALVLAFVLAAPAASGQELRAAAERYVASLPDDLAAVGAARPSVSCASRPSKKLSEALGLIAGAGLGFALGRGTGRGPLEREFEGFGLRDSLITAGALAVAIKGYALVDRPLPDPCGGDCVAGRSRGLDDRVRSRLRLASADARSTANSVSYGTVFATLVMPSAFLASRPHPVEGREFWMTIESGALTAAVLQVVKHRVHRPRPYARYCVADCADAMDGHKSHVSFFSGHTALAFSFAVSAGTIASMRGYENAGWVLGSGLTLAATTGYLRIAADRHYLSDVLVGAVVGSAIGWAVPKLHGMRDAPPTQHASGERRSRPILLPLPLHAADGRLRLQGSAGTSGLGLAVSWQP